MKRALTLLVLLLMPVAALADGMVVPPAAFPARVSIPDQRALIHFTNGTERLVIETRFSGEGTNFAWILPLPSQPVIEEATTGLFPTLQYLFRPRIIHNVTRYYLAILICIGIVGIIVILRKSGLATVADSLMFLFVLFFLAALFFPVSGGLSKAGISPSASQEVSVLDRKIVGIFETATIASRDAHALQSWLTENGFAMPTNAEPVIASYVKDGWVFVAAKVNRENPANAISTPHPLSFTFKTEKPVYPMRLTGLNSDSLKVEIYVFGPARAEAGHFKIERCTRPNYPALPAEDRWSWRGRASPEVPDIVHPLLRQWVDGSLVATKLSGTLSSADMREDVWLRWTDFAEKKNRVFSKSGALTTGLNVATVVFVAGCLLAGILCFNERQAVKFPGRIKNLLLGSLLLAGLIYLALPKIEVRLTRNRFSDLSLSYLSNCLRNANLANTMNLQAEARRALSNLADDTNRRRFAPPELNPLDNTLLGGQIHEEDSPGNYTIREKDGELELVGYDAGGAEHVEVIPR